MQVWPALAMPPQTAPSAAAARSASLSTMSASLPPHSATIGVRVSAQVAITRFAVAVDPVKATLSTPARHSAAPVEPSPVTSWRTGCSGTTSAKALTSQAPTPGVNSLGLKTTALPPARA